MASATVAQGGVACLRARVDAVEDPRLGLEVEPGVREVLVPVRVLDHDLDLRVDGLRRGDDQALRGLLHEVQPELAPAARALRLDVALPLRRGEEEVVEDQLVEEAGREPHHLLDVLAVGGVGVAELLELEALVGDERDPARGLDPPALEEPLGLQHGLAVVRDPAAVHLQVDLADLQVLRERLEALLEPVSLGHAADVVHAAVDGELEVAVARGLGQRRGSEESSPERGAPETTCPWHHRPPRIGRRYTRPSGARERQRHHGQDRPQGRSRGGTGRRDPRRTQPARLKTVLRQPVRRLR